jgi:hypothetical protein
MEEIKPETASLVKPQAACYGQTENYVVDEG